LILAASSSLASGCDFIVTFFALKQLHFVATMKNSNVQSGGRLVLLLMVAVAMSWLAMGLVDGEFPRPKIQAFKLYSEFRSTRDHIFQLFGV
jgi:hypothetical protein